MSKVSSVKVGKLEYLRADNLPVPHCFTTRYGGVSQGHLATLNLGTRRGDTQENVLTNYRILGDAVGFAPEDLVLTKQTHTDIVRVVGQQHRGAGLFAPELAECDGLVTDTPGVALAVFTADCTPILLYDPVTGAVGAVHAGWRGTVADIAGKAVAAMEKAFSCAPENLRAAIGPNIAQCCFQTDADVPAAVLAQFGKEAQTCIAKKDQKYYVNLKAVNALALQRAGVRDIAVCQLCTACAPDRFWSHRVVGQNRGALGAIIVCKGGEE